MCTLQRKKFEIFLGNLLWALELLQQCKNFFGVIVLQFVGHLLSGSVVGLMTTSSKRTYAKVATAFVLKYLNNLHEISY